MKKQKVKHHILFTDGSHAHVKSERKDGSKMNADDAIIYAEKVFNKKVKSVETW